MKCTQYKKFKYGFLSSSMFGWWVSTQVQYGYQEVLFSVQSPYIPATAWCLSATTARCSGFVNPSVIKTLQRSTILKRSGGLNHSKKQLVKSLQWIMHLNLQNVGMNLSNTRRAVEWNNRCDWCDKECQRDQTETN